MPLNDDTSLEIKQKRSRAINGKIACGFVLAEVLISPLHHYVEKYREFILAMRACFLAVFYVLGDDIMPASFKLPESKI